MKRAKQRTCYWLTGLQMRRNGRERYRGRVIKRLVSQDLALISTRRPGA